MPVTTRSQSKKRIQETKNSTTLTQLPNPESQLSESDVDFINDVRNRITESQELTAKFRFYSKMSSLTKGSINEKFTREHFHYYFKNLRHLTEMFQLIDSRFDVFFVPNGKVSNKTAHIQRLINVILSKCDEFTNHITDDVEMSKNLTQEYAKVLDDFKVQLQKTKALFEPYGSSEKKESRYPKRSIRPVCYAGMDTENSYDAITNICFDCTNRIIDPDYVYELDEDDEDDDESYVSDNNEDEEEFEDYDSDGEDAYSVYSDQTEDCFDRDGEDEDDDDNDFTVEKVNDRHIRFVYK
jgi:hypothetical protein